MIQRADGFAGLKALLPPPSRRGLVLIDPPYEDKDDYRKVKVALDGEIDTFALPLRFAIAPRPLRLLVPRGAEPEHAA